jgi:hypothetical protein
MNPRGDGGSRLREDLARGRRAFIWRWGVLRAGVTVAVISALTDEVWQGEHLLAPAWLSMIVRLLLYVVVGAPLFGAVWGWVMWTWLSRRIPPASGERDTAR